MSPTLENAAETTLWIAEQGGCQGIFHAINEDDLRRIMRHPATMIASDGEVVVFRPDGLTSFELLKDRLGRRGQKYALWGVAAATIAGWLFLIPVYVVASPYVALALFVDEEPCPPRIEDLRITIAACDPDIVCLQELKAAQKEFPRAEIEAAGYAAVWRGQRSWNGVAILSRIGEPVLTRDRLPCDPDEGQARYIEAAVSGMLIGFEGKRLGFGDVLAALRETGTAVLDIFMIGAAAGMVIGVLNLSGLGFGLTLSLVTLGGGNGFLLLLIGALICIVLGMGMPTAGVYILLSTLVAPALVEVGFLPIAAHLFILYFGMMSMITPPVAIAAFAAASIARADPMRTGWEACRFGWSAYVVPFLFVLSPTLLLIGPAEAVALAIVTATLGIWLVSIGMIGFFMRPMGAALRAAFMASGLLALIPAGAFPGAVWTDILGATLGALLMAREVWIVRLRERAPA